MIPRYSRPDMVAIWEPDSKFRIWLEIEAHACDAQAKLGVVPESAAKAVWARGAFEIDRIDEIESETKHDVIAFLTNVAEHVGEEARFLHQGMTSSDVVDTCLAVQLARASDILLADMDALLAQVAALDLVITTSQTVAHVAGGLGVPVWVLLPRGGGLLWYWFLEGERSPFYASARLFRQAVRGGWTEILECVASRLAHAFFTDVIKHCNALVDLHTGSFYRTNITQLRADMSKPTVAEFADLFGDIPVLNTGGNGSSLRAAAVRAGIPAVTLEAGEPMRMQVEVVEEGVKAINTLLEKNGMYPSFSLWAKPSPAFYRSAWVRANSSGILFSKVELGGKVKKGDILGQVINPMSNEKRDIVSAYEGRVLGMALDQFVLPGFAAYHIGILQPRTKKKSVMPVEAELIGSDDDGMLDVEQKPSLLETPKPMTPEEEGFDDE